MSLPRTPLGHLGLGSVCPNTLEVLEGTKEGMSRCSLKSTLSCMARGCRQDCESRSYVRPAARSQGMTGTEKREHSLFTDFHRHTQQACVTMAVKETITVEPAEAQRAAQDLHTLQGHFLPTTGTHTGHRAAVLHRRREETDL